MIGSAPRAALDWIALVPEFSIKHVRREFNKEADRLANKAMDGKRTLIEWAEPAG